MTKVDFSQIKNKRLNGLDDVNAPSPSDGQVLQWKSSIQKWAPATPSGGGGGGGGSLTVTDDGNGNISVSAASMSVNDDGDGNITISFS